MAQSKVHEQIIAATKTVAGYAVRNIRYNRIPNMYTGQVEDPQNITDNKWSQCDWDKRGRCKNQIRTDCHLVLVGRL